MKFVSWNVNGLRAIAKKGFLDIFNEFDADIFAIQETKLQQGQNPVDFGNYFDYWSYAKKPGYSGTAVFSKNEPMDVIYGIGVEQFDAEGRVTCLEFKDFYFVCVYTPNAQNELARIDFRCSFEDSFRKFLCELAKKKNVVVCGDMNVAHEEIDLARPKQNVGNAGFSDQERGKMTELLSSGFVDTWRFINPDLTDKYSWWSYRGGARQRNVGWRIDYFLVSKSMQDKIKNVEICDDILGSDHCPITLELAV